MASTIEVSAPSSDPGTVLVVNLEQSRQIGIGLTDFSVVNPVEFWKNIFS
jgi:hypothetical protein